MFNLTCYLTYATSVCLKLSKQRRVVVSQVRVSSVSPWSRYFLLWRVKRGVSWIPLFAPYTCYDCYGGSLKQNNLALTTGVGDSLRSPLYINPCSQQSKNSDGSMMHGLTIICWTMIAIIKKCGDRIIAIFFIAINDIIVYRPIPTCITCCITTWLIDSSAEHE